jgi:hypothetical protein
VCQYLNRLDEMGIPPRSYLIHEYANSIIARSQQAQKTCPERVSDKWTRPFPKRYSKYKISKQKTLDVNHEKAHHTDDLWDWFAQYKEIKEEMGILPRDCYNFDEAGFRIRIGKDQWVVKWSQHTQCT